MVEAASHALDFMKVAADKDWTPVLGGGIVTYDNFFRASNALWQNQKVQQVRYWTGKDFNYHSDTNT